MMPPLRDFDDMDGKERGQKKTDDLRAMTTLGPRTLQDRERSGSVVECLTRDRRAAGLSLTGVTALWSLSKTHLS